MSGQGPVHVRVLHVDEDPDVRGFTKLFLEEIDDEISVDSVESGEEALDRLLAERYDCLLTDFRLHGMDGIQLTATIRETSVIPIVMYTGSGNEEVASRALAAGVDDYIRKESERGHYTLLARSVRAVTERKRVEQLYRSIAEDGSDACSISVDDRIVYANKAFAELVGEPEASRVVGEKASLFLPPEEQEWRRSLPPRQAPGESPPEYFEFTLTHPDGRRVVCESSGARISFEGREAGLAFTRDITGRKRVEEQLRVYAERLKEQVEKRSQELVEAEQLAVAGRVASHVGHDIRSPLQNIKNAAYLIRTRPEQMDAMLRLIEGSIERSLVMLEELRQKTKESPLLREPVDLGELVSRSVEETPRPEYINLNVSTQQGLGGVLVDVVKVKRVIENMVRNAYDAMQEGGELTVSVERVEGGYEIKFRDTGVGIPPEKLAMLFKPFFTTKPKGLGLGLSSCQKAVEAHGGRITVESEVSAGTVFTVFLPETAKKMDP